MNVVHRAGCAALFIATAMCGADQIWSGQITDSVCAQMHPSQGSGKTKKDEQDLATRRQCTLTCIKNGASYIFVADGKVFQIENQNDPSLMKHAGEKVKIAGTLKISGPLKEETITISNIEVQQ
jgi:hypothetical protein